MMLAAFLSGAITIGFLVAALFFLRFWRRSGERLFISFAIAFFMLGLAQAILALSRFNSEEHSWPFVLRLAAFLLIAVAIIRKNRRG